MTNETEYQMSIFDLDIWSSRTCRESTVREHTRGQTSKSPSRKSSASQTRMPILFLCRKKESGNTADASTMSWENGLLPFPYTMQKIGEFRKDENGSVLLPISTDSQHSTLCLSLRCGEMPDEPMPTKLSEILETEKIDSRYYLSAKACNGILNRAARRGKGLPEILKTALENQANRSNCDSED